MAQVARERALKRFREGKVEILVATDVAARGIDVEGVTHVINYTCPEDEKTYVHRIGRTGRAGATGVAITFVDWADVTRWKVINKALDLPYDEPQETYSTSEHLFHDQGIPSDAKGRIGEPGAAPAADDARAPWRLQGWSRCPPRRLAGRPAVARSRKGLVAGAPTVAARPERRESGDKPRSRHCNRRRTRGGELVRGRYDVREVLGQRSASSSEGGSSQRRRRSRSRSRLGSETSSPAATEL